MMMPRPIRLADGEAGLCLGSARSDRVGVRFINGRTLSVSKHDPDAAAPRQISFGDDEGAGAGARVSGRGVVYHDQAGVGAGRGSCADVLRMDDDTAAMMPCDT